MWAAPTEAALVSSALLDHRVDDPLGDVDHLLADVRAAAVELAAGDPLAHVGDLEQTRHPLVVDVLERTLGLDRSVRRRGGAIGV